MSLDLFRHFAASCNLQGGSGGIDFIPTWYQYLKGKTDALGECVPDVNIPGDAVNILLALIEILLTVGGIAAVGFVIYGGIKYILGQGEPDKIKDAQQSILNAVVGLVIMILATSIVKFIGSRLVA